MSLTQSIHIDAPVEKVYGFYEDPRTAWSVMAGAVSEKNTLTDVKMTGEGVGTQYDWTVDLWGLKVRGFNVYTDVVPNRRITDRSSRSLVGTWTTVFEPEGSGTRVTMHHHPVASRALRPVDRAMDRVRVPLSRQTLEKMKAALEQPAEPAGEPAAPGRRSGR